MQSLRESSCRGRKLNNAFPQLKYPQNRCPAFFLKKRQMLHIKKPQQDTVLEIKIGLLFLMKDTFWHKTKWDEPFQTMDHWVSDREIMRN